MHWELALSVRAAWPDSMGTYECLLAASDQPSLTDAALAASLNSYCHVIPDKFVTLAYFPSGIMIKWFHDLLYAEAYREGALAQNGDRSYPESIHYARLEREAPARPNGSLHYSQSDRYLQSGLQPTCTWNHFRPGPEHYPQPNLQRHSRRARL